MRKDFYISIHDELQSLKDGGTYKYYKSNMGRLMGSMDLEKEGNVIVLNSNNYAGLAGRQELVDAGKEALDTYGAGAGSVRFISGNFKINEELERVTADFLGMEDSLAYSSCYAANNAVIPSVVGQNGIVLSDSLNHASIIDGCRLIHSSSKTVVYQHSNMEDLEAKLKEVTDKETVLIVTDGVFSMDGDIAKLPEIVALAKKYNALVMVDDSHGIGAVGKTGRGTCEYHGVTEGVDIISGTYGKALGGASGGFIAGSKDLCDILKQRSRTHIFSNSMPPVLCGIAIKAIQLIDENPQMIASLKQKTDYMRKKILEMGLKPVKGDSPIIPIIVGDAAKSIEIAAKMMEGGVYAIGFGFPVVPEGTARIRLQVSEGLSYEQIDKALEVIEKSFKSSL